MDHVYYSDGNEKKISWIIETGTARVDQVRTHIDDYYEKITVEQSKYVALHVGIFWGIGRFIIKNGDTIGIMLDLRSMFEYLAENKQANDPFVNSRGRFIKQLTDQRKLTVRYHLVEHSSNKAAALLL